MRISDWSSDVCSSDLTKAIYRALSGLGVSHEMQEVLCSCQAARGGIAFKASIVIIGRRRAVHPVTLSHISSAGKGQRLRAKRSEERRVGNEGVRTCRSGWSPDN